MRGVKPLRMDLQRTHPLAQGLHAAWMFNDKGGAIAEDSSILKRDASILSSVTWVNDQFGPALSFPGSGNNAVLAASHPAAALPITMVMRVKPTVTNPIGMFDSAPSAANTLRNHTAGRMEWHNNNPGVIFAVTANAWSDIVVVFYHDTTRQVYIMVNGVIAASGTGTAGTTVAWTSFRVGDVNSGGASRFTGLIDHFMIYSGRAWGPAEAALHHRDPYALFRGGGYMPLKATAVTTSSVQLDWSDNAGGGQTFSVERSSTGAYGGFVEIASGLTAATHTDTGLTDGTYYYRVRGFDGANYTDYTNVVAVTVTA